jgi:hypothetical protein
MRFFAVLLISLMAAGCAAQQLFDASGSSPRSITPQLLLENVKMTVNATDTDKAAALRVVKPF